MLTLTFLVKMFIDFCIMVLLLRIWMQWTCCNFYNSFSQFIVKITQPVIGPLRRIMPMLWSLDTASLLLAFILAMIKVPLLMLIEMHVLIFDPIYLLIDILILLKLAGELVFLVMITRALLSWISQGRSQMDMVIHQLSKPLIDPIRRILPDMGRIDFSAIIVILVLYALNYLGMDLFPEIWYRL